MSDLKILPIPLWREQQRMAMACFLAAALLLWLGLSLMDTASQQRSIAEDQVAELEPPTESESSPTSTSS